MASLVAAAPGPPPAMGPASAAPGPNVGRTWRLIPDPDPTNPQGFLLLIGRFDPTGNFLESSRFPIGTNLPDIPDSRRERLGDIVKDMVDATVELKRLIINEVILPAYLPEQLQGDPGDFYNFLMANKVLAQTQLVPYITEGIFARSSVKRDGIGDFLTVVPESGDKGAPFSTRYDPSNPGSVRYLNTGAIPMDPSSSNAGGNPLVWPPIGDTVHYGDDCLFRFGLPHGLMWQAKTLGNNQFEYTINPQPIGIPTPPRPFRSDSIPSIITEGNRARMQRFSGLLQNGSFPPGIRPEALQSTIYKEEGDLMQILEYLCFYYAGYIHNSADPDPFEEGIRKKSVMVTTDEVVFKICCDLGIPCIYTGGKSVDPETGVHISGYGAYKFYNPVIDRATAFKNTIMNIFNNKKGINDVQIQLLKDIKWKDRGNKNIYYYKQPVEGRPSRTDGMRVCFRPSTANVPRYNAHIQGLIDGITQKNAALNGLKDIALGLINDVIEARRINKSDEDMSKEEIALENTTIAGIIQPFDAQSKSPDCLTQLYLDKTNGPTSVYANATNSTIYNCIDVPLCAKLTSGFVGGGKITGGIGFTQEEWDAFKRDEFNIAPGEGRQNRLTQEYPAYFITDDLGNVNMEDVTTGEYNVLLILCIMLEDKIKTHLRTSIGLEDDDYFNLNVVSMCLSIYSRYSYFVSLINHLPVPVNSEPEYGFDIKIRELCHFESLYLAITQTLALIGMGLDPTFKGQLAEIKFTVDKDGYIRGRRSDNAETILQSVIFLQPDESYNAPGLPRFTSGAARAPQMPSRASSNTKMSGIGRGPAMDLDLDDERPVPPLFRSVTDLNAAAASSDATMQNYKSLADKEERPTARLAWSHGDDAARAPVGKPSFRVRPKSDDNPMEFDYDFMKDEERTVPSNAAMQNNKSVGKADPMKMLTDPTPSSENPPPPPTSAPYNKYSNDMQVGNGGPEPNLLLPGAWSFKAPNTGLPPPPIGFTGRTVSELQDPEVSSRQPQGPKYDRSFKAKYKSRTREHLKKQTTSPDPDEAAKLKYDAIRERQSRKADEPRAERMGKIRLVATPIVQGAAEAKMDVANGGKKRSKTIKRTRKNKQTKTIKKSKPKGKNKTKRKNNINRK